MNDHQHKVLKKLREVGETDANTLLECLGSATAGEFVLLAVIQELADLGYVVAKTYSEPVFQGAAFWLHKPPTPVVYTRYGWAKAEPTEIYWVVTPAGVVALDKLKPQYLGETPVDLATHPVYSKYTPTDWALLWITMYSGIDGAHHKDWLIAEVTKILNNTQVIAKMAKWSNGQEEERFELAEPSEQFNAWKMAYEGDVYPEEDGGGTEYEFNEGIPP